MTELNDIGGVLVQYAIARGLTDIDTREITGVGKSVQELAHQIGNLIEGTDKRINTSLAKQFSAQHLRMITEAARGHVRNINAALGAYLALVNSTDPVRDEEWYKAQGWTEPSQAKAAKKATTLASLDEFDRVRGRKCKDDNHAKTIEDLTLERDSVITARDDLQGKYSQLEKRYANLQATYDEADAELKKAVGEKRTQAEELTRITEQLATVRTEADNVRSQLQAKATQYETLEHQLKDAKNARAVAEEALKDAHKDTSITEELTRLKQEADALRSKISQYKGTPAEIETLRTNLTEKEAQYTRLETQFNETKTELRTEQEAAQKLRDALTAAETSKKLYDQAIAKATQYDSLVTILEDGNKPEDLQTIVAAGQAAIKATPIREATERETKQISKELVDLKTQLSSLAGITQYILDHKIKPEELLLRVHTPEELKVRDAGIRTRVIAEYDGMTPEEAKAAREQLRREIFAASQALPLDPDGAKTQNFLNNHETFVNEIRKLANGTLTNVDMSDLDRI